jgi:hypothetical protein
LIVLLGADERALAMPAGVLRSGGAVENFSRFMDEASRRFSIPAAWIAAVMRIESAGDPAAQSAKGAMGLMQLMPQTWTDLKARYGLGADPFDPHDNITAGAAYLRDLRNRYGAPGFLAAYNAGPARYEDYIATGRPLPAETRSYLAVLSRLMSLTIGGDLRGGERGWASAPLFAPLRSNSPARGQAGWGPPANASEAADAALAGAAASLFVGAAERHPQP